VYGPIVSGKSFAAFRVLATSLLLGLACGGDSDPAGSCGAFSACGGDPTGTWQGQAVCLEGDLSGLAASAGDFPAACRDGVIIDAVTLDTTLDLQAVGTYTERGSLILDWTFRFDAECFSAFAGQTVPPGQVSVYCDLLEQTLADDPESPFETLACTMSNGTCNCDGVQAEPIDSAGTFDVQSGTLTLDGDRSRPFCARGDTLELQLDDEMLGHAVLSYER
jgi:hypothetical protein